MSYTNYYPNSSIFHASMFGIMGTQLDLLLIGDQSELLTQIWREMERELRSLHFMMSRFDPESELYKINSTAKEKECSVSPKLFKIIKDCVKFNRLTSGYFDISLGFPNQLILNDVDLTIRFENSSMALDLGGYGKGYALNELKKIGERYKVSNFLINFGNSSILAKGHHPYGDCWSVDVNNPYNGELLRSYNLFDSSLTSSGNTPSHPKHIINPKTGLYFQKRSVVSVCCDDPILGEVLTTATMLMDKREIEELELLENIVEIDIVNL